MTPTFEFFDVASSRRAYHSAAERERAGYLAELTHGVGAASAIYDGGVELAAVEQAPRLVTVGLS